jgi:hypothetical protein
MNPYLEWEREQVELQLVENTAALQDHDRKRAEHEEERRNILQHRDWLLEALGVSILPIRRMD